VISREVYWLPRSKLRLVVAELSSYRAADSWLRARNSELGTRDTGAANRSGVILNEAKAPRRPGGERSIVRLKILRLPAQVDGH
jgi:hypothetical protein